MPIKHHTLGSADVSFQIPYRSCIRWNSNHWLNFKESKQATPGKQITCHQRNKPCHNNVMSQRTLEKYILYVFTFVGYFNHFLALWGYKELVLYT